MSDAPDQPPPPPPPVPPAATPVSPRPAHPTPAAPPRCRRCNHDLTGLPTGRNCPACGSAVAISRPEAPTVETACDITGHVIIDLPCQNCGANLRDHLHFARCAACGVAVSRSLRGSLPPVIQSDLRCARCGGGLVGVGVRGHCRQCGLSVQESVASGGWTPSLDEHGVVAANVQCLKCAYNVRGLHRSGRCPECGTPVEISVHGDFLCYAAPLWVRKLSRGAAMVLWGVGLMVFSFISLFAFAFAAVIINTVAMLQPLAIASLLLLGLCVMAAWVLVYVGAWFMSAPEPGRAESDAAARSRRFIRVSLAAGLVAIPVGMVADHASLPPAASLALDLLLAVLYVLNVLGIVAYYALLRRLAQRVPDDTLARRARFLRNGFAWSLGIMLLMILAAIVLDQQAAATAQGRDTAENITAMLSCIGMGDGLFILILVLLAVGAQTRLRRALREQSHRALRHWEWTIAQAPPPAPASG